jgi:carboxylate-amine ligase
MGAIDLVAAEEVFAASTDCTVGIEEELQVLDAASLDLVPRFEELRDLAAADDPVLSESIAGELISSEIEIRSGRGEDFQDALRRQRDVRARLFALAEARGIALGATGTHPWADYRDQRNIETEHYQRVVDGLQYVARRNNTFSLHVHVGAHDLDRAVRACDRLRPVLPLLLAISANSPYLDARDSGLHSARSQAFTKSFPRCGIPDAFGSWAAYREYIDFLLRTDAIMEYTQVWWSIRPHFAFGTVEVRICDAQTSGPESEALAGLIVACVAQALRDNDERVPFADPARRLVEENFWRAIRYGLEGNLIDLDRAEQFPAAAAIDRLLQWTAPVRAELGIEPAFPALNGAQRQRQAIAAGASMQEVFSAAVRETSQTYVQEAKTA